eukprot:jgi/Astpho2/1400/Aster-x0473
MGKNQQHKAAQRSRHGGGDGDAPDLASGDGVDVSFHTPEWHAARLEALTTERMSWEDWKKKQKEEAAMIAAAQGDEDKLNSEFKAQLAADRDARLGGHSGSLKAKGGISKAGKSSKAKHGKDSKRKEKKSKKSKSKHGRDSSSNKVSKRRRQSSSESSSSGTDACKGSRQAPQAADGPMRLSEFFSS